MKIKVFLIFICACLSAGQLFSNNLTLKKLYLGKSSKLFPFLALVEFKNDSVSIEIVHNYYDDAHTLKYAELLSYMRNDDTLCSSEKSKIYRKNDKLFIDFLVYKRLISTELIDFETKIDQIELIRNNYYRLDMEDKSQKFLDSVLGKQNYNFREFNLLSNNQQIWEKERTYKSSIFRDSINYWSQIGINKTLEKEEAKIENLKILLSKNDYNFEEINAFLLANNFEKKIEKEILTYMIQKNTETFLKVLESQNKDFNTSNLRKEFFTIGEMNQKEYYKPILASLSSCNYESKFKKAILKSISKGKRQHAKFISAALISPVLVITIVFALII